MEIDNNLFGIYSDLWVYPILRDNRKHFFVCNKKKFFDYELLSFLSRGKGSIIEKSVNKFVGNSGIFDDELGNDSEQKFGGVCVVPQMFRIMTSANEEDMKNGFVKSNKDLVLLQHRNSYDEGGSPLPQKNTVKEKAKN